MSCLAQTQLEPHQFDLSERLIGNQVSIGGYHLLNIPYNRQIGSFNLLDESAFHHNNKFLSFPRQMDSVQNRTLKIGLAINLTKWNH